MEVIAVTGDGDETVGKGKFFRANFLDDKINACDDDEGSAIGFDYDNDNANNNLEGEKNLALNKQKSEAYKKLVLDMQKKYPLYGAKAVSTDISQKINQKADPGAKKVMQDFAATFQNKQDFYDTLKEMGLEWMEVNHAGIYEMRAKEALRIAIEDGFDPFNFVTKKDAPVELFAPVVNDENICHEINLYTYWQGFNYAEKTPHIKYLLVAQDWGNPFISEMSEVIDTVQRMNAGDKSAHIYSPDLDISTLKPGTDKNLFELFEILGYDIRKHQDDLFFTNFCLGYRSGKIVGGMTEELMMKDSAEFKRLCKILEPENILCLGRLTFECTYEVLSDKKATDLKLFNGAYNTFLEKHEDIEVNCGSVKTKIYPLVHCGAYGTMNRNKNLLKQNDILYYQKQDWSRIANDNK